MNDQTNKLKEEIDAMSNEVAKAISLGVKALGKGILDGDLSYSDSLKVVGIEAQHKDNGTAKPFGYGVEITYGMLAMMGVLFPDQVRVLVDHKEVECSVAMRSALARSLIGGTSDVEVLASSLIAACGGNVVLSLEALSNAAPEGAVKQVEEVLAKLDAEVAKVAGKN